MFNDLLAQYLPMIFQALMVAIFGILARVLRNVAQKTLDNDTKRALAKAAVLFVEQTFKDLHGADKLAHAMDCLSSLLAEKHIEISSAEMNVLLEAAVGEFNEVFKKD